MFVSMLQTFYDTIVLDRPGEKNVKPQKYTAM